MPAAERAADDVLVRRIAEGDRRAWTALVDRHAPPLHCFAWRMLGDQAEAEDVVQDAMMRLLHKVARWEPGQATLRTWLYRVTTNLCIDRRRRKRSESLDGRPDVADPVTGERLAARLDVTNKVKAAMADLPPRQRVAVTLVHYEGFTQIEAAELINVSVDAFESLLARGRRGLRVRLAHVAEDLLMESA